MTDAEVMSKADLLDQMEKGWSDLNTYLNTLTEAQLTKPTDAAGWTVKDHLMHLAVWEDGMYALLRKENRRERMGIDKDTWESGDFDAINAVIQQRYKDQSLADVRKALRDVHHRFTEKIQSMSDADLQRPYSYYDPSSTRDKPVIGWVISNSYAHYAEHRPWMDAIAKGS